MRHCNVETKHSILDSERPSPHRYLANDWTDLNHRVSTKEGKRKKENENNSREENRKDEESKKERKRRRDVIIDLDLDKKETIVRKMKKERKKSDYK